MEMGTEMGMETEMAMGMEMGMEMGMATPFQMFLALELTNLPIRNL
jgi:hypothetical protein